MRILRRALLPVLTLLLAIACRGRFETADPTVLLDPYVVDTDPFSFRQSFNGEPGDLVMGRGWYGFEKGTGDWSSFSWAAQSATVHFGRPLSGELDLVVRCLPFLLPGSPPQGMTVLLNGQELSARELLPTWHEARFPLPSRFAQGPVNTLEFRFAFASAPSELNPSGDPRRLAAAFDELAVVPRGAPLARPNSAVRRAESASLDILLSASGLTLPLPGGKEQRLRFAVSRPSRPGLLLSLAALESPGLDREVWGWPAEKARKSLEFSLTGSGPARLLLRMAGAQNGPALAGDSVSLEVSLARSSSPSAPKAPARPNVFIYLMDTLRADALGTFGATVPSAPRMDAFARDAVTFERAWSTSSWTLPATASVLSGVYPAAHGAVLMGDGLPAGGIPWLPQLLRDVGYEVLGVLQWPLTQTFGFERGFEALPLDVRLATKSRSETARGLFWQQLASRRSPERPLFGYVHTQDPHAMYLPEGEDRVFAERRPGKLPRELYNPHAFQAEPFGKDPAEIAHLRALYDGEVHYADRQFGAFLDLLKFVGLYEDSLIVLVSDHGEEFSEHGGFDHARTLYEEVVRIPLVVKFPRSRGKGTRIVARVSGVDIVPTVLHEARVRTDSLPLHGRRLPETEPSASAPPRTVFAQLKREDAPLGLMELQAIATGALKCIRESRPAARGRREATLAFDLEADPRELSPLAPSDPRFGRCAEQLDLWRTRTRALEAAAREGKRAVFTPEEVRKLRSLGYLQ